MPLSEASPTTKRLASTWPPWWYRYYAKEQSPEDRGRYESAEDEAKARGWGLWADPNPISPYEWRKSHRRCVDT
jgi:endonuclease YncB( thermonuclease family)